tara:strand:- start:4 stop:399 length:396 start_codon:yes stop_codon:yes gene_type:complete
MAITFTWSVKEMHKVTATGAVYRVDWSCSGVDADTEVSHSRSGSYNHTTSVTTEVVSTSKHNVETTQSITKVSNATPDHTASGFTPYADLTKADVLAWCKADGVGTENEALITKSINTKIAAQANSTGLPW